MCRNIRILHHFEPPTTPQEIEAAAIQYVRKVSGTLRPSQANQPAFDAAVKAIADATATLLHSLEPPRTPPRTREGEAAKAKTKWEKRVAAATRG